VKYGKIVFDLDGTYWQKQVDGPKSIRRKEILPDIPLLISLLETGFEVAVCSGNSASHIIGVLVRRLLKTLYLNGQLELARNFYAFFQLGGGLARFSQQELAKWQKLRTWEQVEKKVFITAGKETKFIPHVIDATYVGQQSINLKNNRKLIKQVLGAAVAEYSKRLAAERTNYNNTKLSPPHVRGDERSIKVKRDGKTVNEVVQITLKQFYSASHFKSKRKDQVSLRTQIAQQMNDQLAESGEQLVAVEGGGTSIDIINHDLSKKTAIEYFLKTCGHDKTENVLYFGDELHAGGNDVVIPLELSVTSFSVGEHAIFHPCVFAAPQPGPLGTFAVLHSLIGFAASHKGPGSVVAAFREKHCREIVVEKLGNLSTEALQSLALIATAESRDKDLADLHRLIGEQVRIRHEDERPPGASHWSESEFES
jgi:hydroxymethylpyrimidine pyrophosphatase-like HAD family hydrolase